MSSEVKEITVDYLAKYLNLSPKQASRLTEDLYWYGKELPATNIVFDSAKVVDEKEFIEYAPELAIKAWRLKLKGKTNALVARQLNVSTSRVRYLMGQFYRAHYRYRHWTFGLLPRTINALKGHTPIDSKEELKLAIENTHLTPSGYKGERVPGFGEKGYSDCCNLVGINSKELLKKANPKSDHAIKRAISLLEENGYQIIPPY